MNRLTVYLEVDGLAVDENGKPAPAVIKLDFGELKKTVTYEEITKNLDIAKLFAAMPGLSALDPAKTHVITPEEYDKRYGEEDKEDESHDRND